MKWRQAHARSNESQSVLGKGVIVIGFFEQYDTSGDGLDFIGKEEKESLIENRTPLKVVRAFRAVSQFGPRYVAVVELDGNERAIGFGAEVVESRDRLFDALIEYFDQEGEQDAPNVYITRVGRSVLVKNADEPAT